MILISITRPTALIINAHRVGLNPTLIVFHLGANLGAAILSSVRKQLHPYHEDNEISASE